MDEAPSKITASPTAPAPTKRRSASDTKLDALKMQVMGLFGAPGGVSVNTPSPNYRGPTSMLRCKTMGTQPCIPAFRYRPKMCLGIDVGERRAGFFIGWQKSPSDPLVWVWEDNVNLFPNHPISVEYLHGVYGTSKLPQGISRWDEVNTLEGVMMSDIEDYKRMQAAMQSFFPSKLESTVAIGTPEPASGESQKKARAKSKLVQAKSVLLKLFFDTARDKNYCEGGIMNRATFGDIPKQVRGEKCVVLRKNVHIYAQYFLEAFGMMDFIFIEEQNARFGAAGEHDEESFRAALERVYPEPDTRYKVYSGSKKKGIYPLTVADVLILDSQRVWKANHFFALGPTGRLVYNVKKIPKPHRQVLEKYQFLEQKRVKKTGSNSTNVSQSESYETIKKESPVTVDPSQKAIVESKTTNPKKRSRKEAIPAAPSSSLSYVDPFLKSRINETSSLLSLGWSSSDSELENDEPPKKKHAGETQFGEEVIDLDMIDGEIVASTEGFAGRGASESSDDEEDLSPMTPPGEAKRRLERSQASTTHNLSLSHILGKFRVMEPK